MSDASESWNAVSVGELREGMEALAVTFVVRLVGELTRAADGRAPRTLRVAAAEGDPVASVDLALWDEPPEPPRPGDTFRLTGGRTTLVDGVITLHADKASQLQKLEPGVREDANDAERSGEPIQSERAGEGVEKKEDEEEDDDDENDDVSNDDEDWIDYDGDWYLDWLEERDYRSDAAAFADRPVQVQPVNIDRIVWPAAFMSRWWIDEEQSSSSL